MTLEELAERVLGWDAWRTRTAAEGTSRNDTARLRGLILSIPSVSHVRVAIVTDVVVSVDSTASDHMSVPDLRRSAIGRWRHRDYIVVKPEEFDEWVANIRRRFVAEI